MDKIDNRILKLIENGEANPSTRVREEFGLSRQAITQRLKNLVLQGKLTSDGIGRGKRYFLSDSKGEKSVLSCQLTIKEIQSIGEDNLYIERVEPVFQNLSDAASKVLHHIFTEMLNNVMDHSKGTRAIVEVFDVGDSYHCVISDDGIGIFESLFKGFHLENLEEAITELLKGKRTTDPDNHAGEELFFSMRMAEEFRIEANGIEFVFSGPLDDFTIKKSKGNSGGTLIYFKLKKGSDFDIKALFLRHTDEQLNFNLNRPFAVEPYVISATGPMISRSEAKRFIAGAETAKSIIIDFKNAESIGQGFVDQIFRVWANKHRETEIFYKNSNSFIELMIKRTNPPANVQKAVV